MSSIEKIHAREILDFSRQSTVEADVGFGGGSCGRARFRQEHQPASTSVELRDGDPKRFDGKGV